MRGETPRWVVDVKRAWGHLEAEEELSLTQRPSHPEGTGESRAQSSLGQEASGPCCLQCPLPPGGNPCQAPLGAPSPVASEPCTDTPLRAERSLAGISALTRPRLPPSVCSAAPCSPDPQCK